MPEFDDLDTGEQIRFKHFFDQIESDVAEAEIKTVIQTSVGKAYKVKLKKEFRDNGVVSPLFVTPDQVIDVLDYEVLYSGENWQLLKSDGNYFFDPLRAKPVPVDLSEIKEAVDAVEGDSE